MFVFFFSFLSYIFLHVLMLFYSELVWPLYVKNQSRCLIILTMFEIFQMQPNSVKCYIFMYSRDLSKIPRLSYELLPNLKFICKINLCKFSAASTFLSANIRPLAIHLLVNRLPSINFLRQLSTSVKLSTKPYCSTITNYGATRGIKQRENQRQEYHYC